MQRLLFIAVLMALFAVDPLYAKRGAPPKVQPIILNGVKYIVPNDDGRRAYVQAWDIASNKMLWEVTVFRNFIIPLAEKDAQFVFIKSMQLKDEKLILISEHKHVYSFDLKTHAVKKE